jgi:hypothetical protein
MIRGRENESLSHGLTTLWGPWKVLCLDKGGFANL